MQVSFRCQLQPIYEVGICTYNIDTYTYLDDYILMGHKKWNGRCLHRCHPMEAHARNSFLDPW